VIDRIYHSKYQSSIMSINTKARMNALSEQLAKPRNPADLGSFEGVPNIPTIATDTIGA
jgi:hypothetical protein